MSECVVRMEMPNGCHDCKLRNMIGNCPIPVFDGQDEEKIWTLAECFQRPPWCPIICSLPEGHGTLIDLETAAEGLSERFNSCHMTCGAVMQFLDGLPTIVPAEAERSEK